MKILVIKTLFCPNKTYLQQNFDSLIKIDTYIKLYNKDIDFDLLWIGWSNIYDNEIDIFLQLLQLKFRHITVNKWKINYGKYYLYENIRIRSFDTEYDYMLFLDHDIYFDFNNCIPFEHIYKLFDNDIENKKIGLISLNQKEDCRHQADIYENTAIISDIHICWSNCIGSIATGCFIIPFKLFQDLEQFDLVTVYGFDDIYIMNKLLDKKYMSVVLKNIYAVHPFCKNHIYDNWKYNCIVKMINNDITDYHTSLEESINLWNKINNHQSLIDSL